MTAYHKIIDEATAFILACYHLSGWMAPMEVRVDTWKSKLRKTALEPPKLCWLLTTSPAFRKYALRAPYQLAVWRDALHQSPPSLIAADHGWSGVEGHANITPTIVPIGTPLTPMELLKIIKCGCDSNMPCSSSRCGCKSHDIMCTMFCMYRGGDGCSNNILSFQDHNKVVLELNLIPLNLL